MSSELKTPLTRYQFLTLCYLYGAEGTPEQVGRVVGRKLPGRAAYSFGWSMLSRLRKRGLVHHVRHGLYAVTKRGGAALDEGAR